MRGEPPLSQPVRRTIAELVLLPMLFVRTGAQQLAYLWLTGEHPETPDDVNLSTDMPLRLIEIEPWATVVVRLAPTVAALAIAWFFAVVGATRAEATLVGPQTLLARFATVYLLVQWIALLVWDPVVLLAQGRDTPEDQRCTE